MDPSAYMYEDEHQLHSETTQLHQQPPSPNSAAFLTLPEDGQFNIPEIFSSGSSSSNHSISSGSPGNDWAAAIWPQDADPSLEYVNPSAFHIPGPGISPSALHSFSTGIFPDFAPMFQQQTLTIQPGILHQKPVPTFNPQELEPVTNAHTTEDVITAVKRMAGVTSLRLPSADSSYAESLDTSPASSRSGRSVPFGLAFVPEVTGIEPPVPSTTSSSAASPQAAPVIGPSGRPKTAHTTIERRYRTNLNTCIVGLRNAIPAVRYLDKAYVSPTGQPDIPDANGCFDGVKGARKISKATILGKAREYITVLKKRENRLQAELDAFKELVGSLDGGRAVMDAWEVQWRARCAQEEKETSDSMEQDESGDEDDEDEDPDERPRKKAKVAPTAAPVAKAKPKAVSRPQTANDAQAKASKKRGRPTKAAQAQKVADFTGMPVTMAHQEPAFAFFEPHVQDQKPVFLLASFLFLSFFKPSHAPTSVHHHDGTVLSPLMSSAAPAILFGYTSDQLLLILHFFVTIGVFCALVITISPAIKEFFAGNGVKSIKEATVTLVESKALTAEENKKHEEWMMDAEAALIAGKLDNSSRMKLIAGLESKASVSAQGLAAILEFPINAPKAELRWKQAGLATKGSAQHVHHLAFDVPLPSAVKALEQRPAGDARRPLAIIAAKALELQIEQELERSFVDEVNSICGSGKVTTEARLDRQQLLAKYAKEVGDRAASLADDWELALSGRWNKARSDGLPSDASSASILLTALGLTRRIFSSTNRSEKNPNGIPSPPPSPLTLEEKRKMERALRVVLDHRVFQSNHLAGEVRSARDAIISNISHATRMRRHNAVESWE